MSEISQEDIDQVNRTPRHYLSQDQVKSIFWLILHRERPWAFEELAKEPFMKWKPFHKSYQQMQSKLTNKEAQAFGANPAKLSELEFKLLLKEHISEESKRILTERDTALQKWQKKFNLGAQWCRAWAITNLYYWGKWPEAYNNKAPIIIQLFNEPKTNHLITKTADKQLYDVYLEKITSAEPEEMNFVLTIEGWRAHLGEPWKVARERFDKQFRKRLKEYKIEIDSLLTEWARFNEGHIEWFIRRLVPFDETGKRESAGLIGTDSTVSKEIKKLAKVLELKIPNDRRVYTQVNPPRRQ